MDILLVEDEKRVASFLTEAFVADGHRVFHCATLGALRDVIDTRTQAFDVAVLDRMLGREDSFTLIRPLKQSFPSSAVVILSAINSPE